jgi:transcriptional regulator with XRE-family HTH domain
MKNKPLTHTAREVIGQFLDERRKALGLSYYFLKKETGLSHRQITGIFTGSENYTIGSFLKITVPLQLYIFFGEKDTNRQRPLDLDDMTMKMKANDPYPPGQ